MTSLENDPRLWDRINRMPIEERERLLSQIRPRIIDPYVPHVPHPTQQVFLSLNQEREVFFGGSAGGGKSDALLAAALAYVDVPGYSALVLRKTFKELTMPEAIMSRANDWLQNTPARKRNGGQYWEFPTGPGRKPATLSFGHLMYHSAVEQYRGAEFQAIIIDELTEFELRTYEFMFSRIRRPALPCENCPRQVEQDPDAPRGVWRHKALVQGGVRIRTCDYPKPNRAAVAEYPPSNVDGVTTLFDVPLRMRTACIDEGDVLTETGWKPIAEVEVGERVYSLTEHGALELQPVEWVYAGPATTDLVRVHKKNLFMSMTTDHRVVYRPFGSPVYRTEAWDQLPNKSLDIVRTSSTYAPEGTGVEAPFGWAAEDYLAYLGLFLAEGCTSGMVRRANYKVVVTQTTTANQQVIKDLLDRLTLPRKGGVKQLPGGSWRARWTEGGQRLTRCFPTEQEALEFLATERAPVGWNLSTGGDFQMTSRRLWEHFAPFGKAHDKFVPREILARATAGELQILLDWLLFGDGHVRENSASYHTVSPQLADDVAEIGVKLGYRVQTSVQELPSEAHRTRYVVYLSQEGPVTKVDRNPAGRDDTLIVPWVGRPVYCLKVAVNSNFVLRQNNFVYVTGNSNPGGVGHAWVRDRFVDPRTKRPGCRFVPSKLTDNPSLDQESYRESLSHMGRKTRLQLEEGLWDVVDENAMLPRHHFGAVEDWPKDKTQYVRYWDLAATAPAPGKTPDWTVGALLALTCDGVWYLVDLRRVQATPAEVERLVTATAQQDVQRVGGVLGRVKVAMEQEPGSAGVGQIATYRRLLAGYPFTGDRPSGSKEERARPLAVAAENNNFKILTAPWNRPFLDECEAFPYGPHDDQVDAVTGAMKMLVPARGKAKLLV